MTTANFDAADMRTAGNINEDVMQQIFDISPVDLPFTEMAGTDGADNQYTEWMTDVLASANVQNAVVDGADATTDSSVATTRVGNHCQISQKTIKVSGRAQGVNSIGRGNELAYQLLQRGREIRRDCEAIKLINQTSVADNGNATAGRLGSVPSWLTSNVSRGATGANGGFSGGTVSRPTPGTKRAFSETIMRDVIESIYTNGGTPSDIMTTVKMKRRISEYLFSSSARIGTFTTNTTGGAATAVGAVDVFVSDFGVLKITPNRFMLAYSAQDNGGGAYGGAGVVDVLFLDFSYWATAYLRGFQTNPIAKTGDADNRQMIVDYTVKCYNQAASGVAADIDQTVAMTA